MLKTLRNHASGLALAAALFGAPVAAHAACLTQPTYGTLSGLDAASASRNLQIFSGASGYLTTPLLHLWNGTTFVAAQATTSCWLDVNIQAGTVGLSGSLPDTAAGDLAATRASVANITPAYATTVTTSFALPTGGTYTTNTAISDSASAPTAGGFTITNACRTSGGSGVITAVSITSSNDPSLLLQGEVWFFDSAVTAINNNASFSISDSDIQKQTPGGVLQFTLATTNAGSGTNSFFTQTNLNIPYTCVGSANLRFLAKAKNNYIWATSEALQFRFAVTALN